jgi:hypothetical protein
MIEYFNTGGRKRPSFAQVEGRIVLVSDHTHLGLRNPVLVTKDDGRAVIGDEIDREWDGMLHRHVYSQNKETAGHTRIDKSAIRVVCDSIAEVDAVMEVARAMEAAIVAENRTAEARMAALEGKSLNATGPLVLKVSGSPDGGRTPAWVDVATDEIIHSFKEN